MNIKIPKSVDNGTLLKIKDKGHQALNGKSGDYILEVVIHPHEYF